MRTAALLTRLLALAACLATGLFSSLASLAAPAAPVPLSPPDGAALADFKPTVAWNLPAGASQYHLQVIPANNDGPGLDLIRSAAGWYTLPEPPHWYGLLPDMTYTWRVRASDALTAVGPDHASWGPWSPSLRFRTPPVSSGSITLEAPLGGAMVTGFTPVLRWADTNPNVWFYEVQVSKDPTFTTDPQRATAAVYWELRHGGVTDPPRSYTVPDAFPLEEGQIYSWRVRPRVQGDGTPLPWSSPGTFRTGTTAALVWVTSAATEPAVVAASAGAALVVPRGAVTPDAAGGPGTTVFSIERNTTLPVTLPPEAARQGAAPVGVSYIFGPAGVPLERPASIWLPVPPGTLPGQASIYRYDLASGLWVASGGDLDPPNHRITATVYQLGAYTVVRYSPAAWQGLQASGPGKLVLRNTARPGSDLWLALCVEAGSARVRYPDLDGAWRDTALGALAAPQETPGWLSEVGWVLPQGSYRLLLTRFSPQGPSWMPWAGNPVSLSGPGEHRVVEIAPEQGAWTSGRAPCAGLSLAAVGTGDVQVTLAWAHPADLDLAVVDPSGETVWFGNPSVPSGGRLDRDTHCGNFQLGRPENIFWPAGSAPRGRYRVLVGYYRDCGGASTPIALAVRILRAAGARTVYSSLVERGEEREVATFEVP